MRKSIAVLVSLWALSAASGGVLAAPAAGAGLSPAVADCYTNGRLTHHYTVPQLRNALNTLPAYLNEYTVCHDVIQRQLLAQIHNLQPGGSGGGGGSFLPTWLLVVLGVLVLGGVGFGAAAIRQRRGED